MSENNDTTPSDAATASGLTHSIKFAVLISLEFPSIFISLLIFGYFGYYRRTRITDYNHSMLLLLLINFLQVLVDLPMPINFFRLNGLVRPATSAFCTWWIWFEFSLNTTSGVLMAWISFERHILIFHRHLIRTQGTWKRRLFHIFPLIFCSLLGPTFYLIAVVISPMCTSNWSFDALLCTIPCYLTTTWGTFDLFFNVISPTCLIFFDEFSVVHSDILSTNVGYWTSSTKSNSTKTNGFSIGFNFFGLSDRLDAFINCTIGTNLHQSNISFRTVGYIQLPSLYCSSGSSCTLPHVDA